MSFPIVSMRFCTPDNVPLFDQHLVWLTKSGDTVGEPICAVTTHNTLRVTRIGFGGNPRGQPPHLMLKGEGTTAWRQSGRQREGAESADPQDLHDVVKAALLEVQFPVGPSQTRRQST